MKKKAIVEVANDEIGDILLKKFFHLNQKPVQAHFVRSSFYHHHHHPHYHHYIYYNNSTSIIPRLYVAMYVL